MIYIREEIMEVESLFREGAFTKRGDSFYFTVVEGLDNSFDCVKLMPEFSDNRYEIKFVKVYTDESEENILSEDKIADNSLISDMMYEFFTFLSYEENPQNVIIYEATVELIKDYLKEGDFSSEGNYLRGECMNMFTLEGKVVEGYYEGNLVLVDIVLKNESTGQEIKHFDRVNVCSNFYIEEDDEDQAEYMVECYVETLGEEDIKNIFLQLDLFN